MQFFFLLSLFYKSSNSAHKISMASHTYRVNWTFAFFYIHISYICLWAINYDTQRRAFTYRFYYDYFIFIYMSVILFTDMIKPMKNNDSIENMKKKKYLALNYRFIGSYWEKGSAEESVRISKKIQKNQNLE